MNENLAKKKKKVLTKRIRKICLIAMLVILTVAFFYMLPFTNELKESLFNNSSEEHFEAEDNTQGENNENDAGENLAPLPDENENNSVNKPTTSAVNKSAQIEINCKKYAAFISNFIMLQEKIMTGKGFSKEINELNNFNIKNNEIKNKIHELSLFAEVGVPTFVDLRDEFYSMANEIIRIYQLENETNKFRKKALKFFQELIFVKKVGERAIKKGGIEGTIQIIRNHLENEEVPEALLEAEKITNEKVKDMVNSWIQDSKNYLKLQAVYEEFKKQAIEKMSCSSFAND